MGEECVAAGSMERRRKGWRLVSASLCASVLFLTSCIPQRYTMSNFFICVRMVAIAGYCLAPECAAIYFIKCAYIKKKFPT